MTKLVFIANTTAAVSEVTHNDKPYLVSPVVAIREGVLNDLLYPASEFGKYLDTWELRPVPISHPKRNGEYVSVNSPDIMETEVIGDFRNVLLDNDKLKGEIWIDLEKAEKIGEPATAVVERLRANEPTEVSTGLFADIEETLGIWTNGESYNGIARNMRPDHLALLPNAIGACSWDDGCGTPRVNQKGVGMGDELKANELTLDDKATIVRRAFWQRMYEMPYDSPMFADYDVVAVFDAVVVAKDWDKKSHVAFSYTMNDGGEVTFGEPVPVEVVYRAKDGGAEVVIANEEAARKVSVFARIRRLLGAGKDEGAGEQPAINEQQEAEGMKKCDMVAALVANKQNKFSNEILDTWSEKDLETLQASLATNSDAATAATPAANTSTATAPAPFDPKQLGEMIKAAVNEVVGPVLQSITANADRERAELVAEITANSAMTADQLKALDVEGLRALAESLAPRDYSGSAGTFRTNESGDEEYVLAMPVAWPVAGQGEGK